MTEKKKPDNRTHVQKLRDENREALREKIRNSNLLSAIMADLENEIEPERLQQVRFKTDVRLKLLDKILPDLKAQEITGAEGGPIEQHVTQRLSDETLDLLNEITGRTEG